MLDDNQIQPVIDLLHSTPHLAILTGAGVSKESGVPTFRDAMEGLWSKYDPAQLATPQAFQQDPALVWRWYNWRRDMVQEAQPNPAHTALAKLQTLKPKTTLITQNVDDLHERAGSQDIIHLHGNIAANRCSVNCQGTPTLIQNVPPYEEGEMPPPCPHCGAYVRPDVVWFGESLPEHDLTRAYNISKKVDVMLVVGTSGIVTPAAHLPILNMQSGGVVIEVNPQPSTLTDYVKHWVAAPAGEILPTIIAQLEARLTVNHKTVNTQDAGDA
jgi:NAD-dependent deacetylase